MRWFAFFAVCFLSVGFLRGGLRESYYANFWSAGKEVPRWKTGPIRQPLSFERLSIEETPGNIEAIRDEISRWSLNECLFALQTLVGRDMARLKNQSGVSWESFLKDVKYYDDCRKEETPISVQDDFCEKVLFAVYNVENFRNLLRIRLKVLGKESDLELQKAVGRYWFGEIEERRTSASVVKTPPLLFGQYG